MEAYLTSKYTSIEERVIDTSRYVDLDRANWQAFSTEYASILRDAGVAFTSTMDKIVRTSGSVSRGEATMSHFKSFLNKHVSGASSIRVRLTRSHQVTDLQPFHGLKMGRSPVWWRAFSDLKHNEMESYEEGNMVNCLNSVAALMVLRVLMRNGDVNSKLFAEVGYPQQGLVH